MRLSRTRLMRWWLGYSKSGVRIRPNQWDLIWVRRRLRQDLERAYAETKQMRWWRGPHRLYGIEVNEEGVIVSSEGTVHRSKGQVPR